MHMHIDLYTQPSPDCASFVTNAYLVGSTGLTQGVLCMLCL